MAGLTFVLGGARSGKSRFAARLAARAERVVFVATAEPLDAEMRSRIARHRRSRPRSWRTVEAPRGLAAAIAALRGRELVLVDCLTLYVSNLVCAGADEERVLADIRRALRALARRRADAILVANEVGLGIVPASPLARRFRDLAGLVNQEVAAAADRVYIVHAGIPVRIKGKDETPCPRS